MIRDIEGFGLVEKGSISSETSVSKCEVARDRRKAIIVADVISFRNLPSNRVSDAATQNCMDFLNRASRACEFSARYFARSILREYNSFLVIRRDTTNDRYIRTCSFIGSLWSSSFKNSSTA